MPMRKMSSIESMVHEMRPLQGESNRLPMKPSSGPATLFAVGKNRGETLDFPSRAPI